MMIISDISDELNETIDNYMKSFNYLDKCQYYMTETFIKELYYASTKGRIDPEMSTKKMMKSLIEIHKYESGIYGYEIDEFQLIDSKSAFIGINRYLHEGNPNRVKYFLLRENNQWKFHHITRSFKGMIQDKLYRDGKVYYIVKNSNLVVIFATQISKEDIISINDYIYVDGFLEVENTIEDEFYYNIHTITVIQ